MGIQSPKVAQPGVLAAVALSSAMVLGLHQADHIRAQTAAPGIAIPADAIFLSGDNWQASPAPGSAPVAYRLYGVQSCLRETFVIAEGQRRDCGAISMVYLAGLVRLGSPRCRVVAESASPRQTLVICRATVGSQEVDLGQAMIAAGFAFAAYAPNGEPVALAYVAAEELARKEKAGLWRYADLPHPMPILLGALKQRGSTPRAN